MIDLITEEYEHETLETLISTPVTFTEVVWGKVLACELLVPIQAGAWLVLLMINGIVILNSGLILLQVTVTSLILILLGAPRHCIIANVLLHSSFFPRLW